MQSRTQEIDFSEIGRAFGEVAKAVRHELQTLAQGLAVGYAALAQLARDIQDACAIAMESQEALQIPEREAREQIYGDLWN